MFWFSVLPPLCITALFIYVLQDKPKLWLTSVAALVPGVEADVKNGGKVVFSLDATADPSQALSMIKATMEEEFLKARGLDRSNSEVDMIPEERLGRDLNSPKAVSVLPRNASGASAAPPKKEVLVSINHLSRAFAVPALLLSLYFWDTTVLRREASETFPLTKCLAGDSYCFYNTLEYSAFRWPEYHELECERMRADSVASEMEFHFVAPKDAKFYKCYTPTFTTRSLIGTVGDIVALFALFMAIVLYFSSQMAGEGYDDEDDLKHQVSRACFSQIVVAVLVFVSALVCTINYGKVSDDILLFFLPMALLVFAFVLLGIRRDLLKDRLESMDRRAFEEAETQTEDEEEFAHGRESSIWSTSANEEQGDYKLVREPLRNVRHHMPLVLQATAENHHHVRHGHQGLNVYQWPGLTRYA